MKKILAVFTGAGLSAESGIPTFRIGANALWEGHSIDEVCNYHTWLDNRQAVHEFYNARRRTCFEAQPNAAHYALADWQKRWGAVLVTQNVDDLLERAGAENVLHLHGSLTSMHCVACQHKWFVGYDDWNHESGTCPSCSTIELVKPDVVFFHEQAPEYAKMYEIIGGLREEDTVVVMGTSCSVVAFDKMLAHFPCHKIINSLNPIEELGKRVLIFNNVLGMTAVEAVPKIEKVLIERMN